jgi:hypothetical protein
MKSLMTLAIVATLTAISSSSRAYRLAISQYGRVTATLPWAVAMEKDISTTAGSFTFNDSPELGQVEDRQLAIADREDLILAKIRAMTSARTYLQKRMSVKAWSEKPASIEATSPAIRKFRMGARRLRRGQYVVRRYRRDPPPLCRATLDRCCSRARASDMPRRAFKLRLATAKFLIDVVGAQGFEPWTR